MKVKLILERATFEMRIKGERYRKVVEVEIPDTDNSQAEEKGVWQIVGYVEGGELTDEEMAEEYLQSIEGDDCVIITDREERKQAFLAGLKAGRPQWHDLRKDKNDLPEEYKIVLCYYVRGYHENEAIYGYNLFTRKEIISSRNMIAWCEIPTFDKE